MSEILPKDSLELLLHGIRSGALELVVEPALSGAATDVNHAPASLEDAFFSLYCYDESYLKPLQDAKVVSRQDATAFQPLGDGRSTAKFKLFGELKKALIQGTIVTDRTKAQLVPHENAYGLAVTTFEKRKEAIKKQEVIPLSSQAFGDNRLLRVIGSEASRRFEIGLAKAEPRQGLTDLVLIRSYRDEDAALKYLRENGLYGSGDVPPAIVFNKGRQGAVVGVYVAPEVAASIRQTAENDVIDFTYGSPDIAALNEAMDNRLEDVAAESETGDDVVDFLDGQASALDVCRLAARFWPDEPQPELAAHMPEQETPRAIRSLPAPKPLAPLVYQLIHERGLTPDHLKLVKTREATGEFNYRLVINPDAKPSIPLSAIWAMADPRRCTQPLPLQVGRPDRSLSAQFLAGVPRDELAIHRAIAQLEQTLGSTLKVEERPFKLHHSGLSAQRTYESGYGARRAHEVGAVNSGERQELSALWLATVGEGEHQQHYMCVAAPSRWRLQPHHIGNLGFSRGHRMEWFTAENEVPAVAALPVTTAVFEDLRQQIAASGRLADLEPAGAASGETLDALKQSAREACAVRMAGVQQRSAVIAKRNEGVAVSAKGEGKPVRTPITDLVSLLRGYSPSHLAVAKVRQTEMDGEAEAVDCLYLVAKKNGNDFASIRTSLLQLKDEKGQPLLEEDDITEHEGHDNRSRILAVHYVPEDVLDGMDGVDRPVQRLADEVQPFADEAVALDAVRRVARERTLRPVQRTTLSATQTMARLPIATVAVQFPSADEWQRVGESVDQIAAMAEDWRSVNAPPASMRQTMGEVANAMKGMGDASWRMNNAASLLASGVDSVRYGLRDMGYAAATHAQMTTWMQQHVQPDGKAMALVIRDAGKETQTWASTLLQQGKITLEPQTIRYSKFRDGKKRKRSQTTALVLYPTAEWLAEVTAAYADQKKVEALPTVQLDGVAIDAVAVSSLAGTLHQAFDSYEQEKREEQKYAPAEALVEACQAIQHKMASHCLLVNERCENPVDGKRVDSHRKRQGVGAAEEDKGSQPVLVTQLQSIGQMKEFVRQCWEPLLQHGLIDGKKTYEPVVVDRARTLNPHEQQIVQAGTRLQECDMIIRELDLPHLASERMRQSDDLSWAREQLKGLGFYRRFFDRLPEGEQRDALWALAANPVSAHRLDFPASLVLGALLAYYDVPAADSLAGAQALSECVNKMKGVSDAFSSFKQQTSASKQWFEEQSGQYSRVKTHDQVLGVSHQPPSLYLLEGTPIDEATLEARLRAGEAVTVKCYFTKQAEALSALLPETPLQSLRQEMRRELDPRPIRSAVRETSGAKPSAEENVDADDTPSTEQLEVKGKHTTAVQRERDAAHHLRYALTGDNAVTAGELKQIAQARFAAPQRGVA